METLESIIFGLKETIKEKDAEIARQKDIIQKQCDFVEKLEADYGKLVEENADLKEKNEKLYEIGLNENTARFEDMKKIDRLEDEIAHKNGIIRLLEKDIEDLHKALEKRVEDVYEDFMKDYKLMREELDGCCEENADLQKQVDELKERYLEESKERLEFEQRYKKIQHAHNIGLGSQRSQWEKKVKQAVKDTAKEIYSLMTSEYECYIPTDIAEEIAKRYGVEVE